MSASFRNTYTQMPSYISSRDPRKLESLLNEIIEIVKEVSNPPIFGDTASCYRPPYISPREAIYRIARLLNDAAYDNPHLAANHTFNKSIVGKECEHLVADYDEETDTEYCADCQEVLSL